jgi:hypothetical protein
MMKNKPEYVLIDSGEEKHIERGPQSAREEMEGKKEEREREHVNFKSHKCKSVRGRKR